MSTRSSDVIFHKNDLSFTGFTIYSIHAHKTDLFSILFQMFSESKDEVCLILVGTSETDNPLADGSCYENITISKPLGVVDFDFLQYVQNDIQPSNVSGDCILLILMTFNYAKGSICIPINKLFIINVVCLSLRFCKFDTSTTFDWLNHIFLPSRSYVTFKCF